MLFKISAARIKKNTNTENRTHLSNSCPFGRFRLLTDTLLLQFQVLPPLMQFRKRKMSLEIALQIFLQPKQKEWQQAHYILHSKI